MTFRDGRLVEVPAMSEQEELDFPPPVGGSGSGTRSLGGRHPAAALRRPRDPVGVVQGRLPGRLHGQADPPDGARPCRYLRSSCRAARWSRASCWSTASPRPPPPRPRGRPGRRRGDLGPVRGRRAGPSGIRPSPLANPPMGWLARGAPGRVRGPAPPGLAGQQRPARHRRASQHRRPAPGHQGDRPAGRARPRGRRPARALPGRAGRPQHGGHADHPREAATDEHAAGAEAERRGPRAGEPGAGGAARGGQGWPP